MLGQLVTKRIGLENGIVLLCLGTSVFVGGKRRKSCAAPDKVLLFSIAPFRVRHCMLRLVLGANTISPTDVGALSVVGHPDDRQCLFLLLTVLTLLLVVSL